MCFLATCFLATCFLATWGLATWGLATWGLATWGLRLMVSDSCKWSVIHTVDELHILLAETTEGWKVIAAFLVRNLVDDHMQTQRVFEQATSTLMKLYEIISRSKTLIPDSIRNGYGMTEFRNFRSSLLTSFCSKRALFHTHYAYVVILFRNLVNGVPSFVVQEGIAVGGGQLSEVDMVHHANRIGFNGKAQRDRSSVS